MKKTVGVLAGLAIAVAAVCTAGAWYTGQQLPAVLDNSIAQSNQQLTQALGASGAGKVELLSLEQHLYSSTARYRLTLDNLQFGGEPQSVQLTFIDRIEHGPLPWSRLKTLQLMPVMATSNYALEKDERSADWFAASNDVSPMHGRLSLGYDRSVSGYVTLEALQFSPPNGASLHTSVLTMNVAGEADGRTLKLDGGMDSLVLTLVEPGQAPVKIDLQGLHMATDLQRTPYDFYVGKVDVTLAQTALALGDKQSTLLLKGLEQRNEYRIDDEKLGMHQLYKVADIAYDGNPVGSAQMSWSLKQLDIPALQAVMAFYEQHMPAFQEAAAAGLSPQTALTPVERDTFQALLLDVLKGQPRFAVEDLSFKTANGQSRFTLNVDLARPATLDQPAELAVQQMVKGLQSNLQLSKPMVGDLAALQARLQGQGEQAIEQASQAGEMLGQMALYSQMVTIKGDDIVTALSYADGQVELNGKNMSLEQFAQLVMSNVGAMSPPVR